jgi:hypothetical protein
MAAGSVSVQGNVSGLPTGGVSFGPLTFNLPTPILSDSVVALSSGNNAVTVPAGSTFVLITGPNLANPIPNPSFGGTITLKGVNGDTGVVLRNDGFLALCLPASASNFVLNASGSATVYVWFA